MTDSHPGNIAFRWTTTFFRALLKQGIEHVVISPGSRSTPLTLAVASNSHFKKHVILDERSAAFTALGIGKATNTPAVLVCTSGTALANYYPAVIEARQSGVPMILATADRPPNLRATGANQAIDQLKIFGDYPVFFHEVGEPTPDENDLERLQILAQQAASLSREKRGAAHLNFAFRKPLEPQPDLLQKTAQENQENKFIIETDRPKTSLSLSNELLQQFSKAQKPIIIVGPLAPRDNSSAISDLAEKLQAPILSEPTIQSPNTTKNFSGFLRKNSLLNKLEPDLILRFGFQPTSKALEQGLKNWAPDQHIHFASTDTWQDATYSGSERIPWDGKPIKVGEFSSSTEKNWLKEWQQEDQDFHLFYQDILDNGSTLTDGSVYHHITPQISDDDFIAVSNSFPARDIHLFGRQSTEVSLYQNRGASGIDGVTSTAMGLSLALQKPGVLFTGDLAFLHDTNALLNAKKISSPLVVFVINNSGGSIFRMLPIQQHENYFEPYFETPQSANIETLVDSYDIPYQKIETLSNLKEFQLSGWTNKHTGLSVIECKTDTDASMKMREKLWDY